LGFADLRLNKKDFPRGFEFNIDEAIRNKFFSLLNLILGKFPN